MNTVLEVEDLRFLLKLSVLGFYSFTTVLGPFGDARLWFCELPTLFKALPSLLICSAYYDIFFVQYLITWNNELSALKGVTFLPLLSLP